MIKYANYSNQRISTNDRGANGEGVGVEASGEHPASYYTDKHEHNEGDLCILSLANDKRHNCVVEHHAGSATEPATQYEETELDPHRREETDQEGDHHTQKESQHVAPFWCEAWQHKSI